MIESVCVFVCVCVRERERESRNRCAKTTSFFLEPKKKRKKSISSSYSYLVLKVTLKKPKEVKKVCHGFYCRHLEHIFAIKRLPLFVKKGFYSKIIKHLALISPSRSLTHTHFHFLPLKVTSITRTHALFLSLPQKCGGVCAT